MPGNATAPSSTLAAEPRETSGATTGLIVRYVRASGGDAAVAEMLRRAGVPHTAAQLEDESRWTSYATRIALFEAATETLGDPATAFLVGGTSLTHDLNHSIVLLLRAMGSPRQVFRQLPRAVPKFSTTSTMEVSETGPTHAVIRYRLHAGYPHSRLDCLYAQGLFSVVPPLFGLPPSRIVHDECESDGYPACVYHVTWAARSRLPWRRRYAVDPELTALRGQLQALQSAAADLVSTDSLETVLQRITDRAAAAVLAPAYLLAVHSPSGGEPMVHSAGLDPARANTLARRLLDDGDIGPTAVVVDVASPRRAHGRLAAIYADGARGLIDEHSMLAAYAGHAAAALDLLVALEESRLQASRAHELLSLAHELARADDAAAVLTAVAAALPRVVTCSKAAVLQWHPGDGELRLAAVTGPTGPQAQLPLGTILRAEDTPELAAMVAARGPQRFTTTTCSPALRQLLGGLGITSTLAVPLTTGNAVLGVATVGWADGAEPTTLDGDVLVQLRGVSDQAATALQRALLLDTVRHQALHDSLTGLPNRVLFADRLEHHLAAAKRHGDVAVLYCDLDRFKRVNDSLGHAAGDELLRQVAERLLAATRPGDTVSRLSGDEFAVLLPGITDGNLAAVLADRVSRCFTPPFVIEGRDVQVSISVGLALHAGRPGGGEELLRAADAAMYRVKQDRCPPRAR